MVESNINYVVNPDALSISMVDKELAGRVSCRKKPEMKQKLKEQGIIGSPSVARFLVRHKSFFGNPTIVKGDGSNFFGEILPLADLAGKPIFDATLKSRMYYQFNLSQEQIASLDSGEFFRDLRSLTQTPEVAESVERAKKQKNVIEKAWKKHEDEIMEHVVGILGYKPENVGKVNVYIMDPKFNIFRFSIVSEKRTSLYYGTNNAAGDINKVIAHMAHQAVHQPMLPYKTSLTGEEKAVYHAFIKFLTDKEIYQKLTGKSILAITTRNENPNIMGKMYPYWLGYKFRNADKDGLDPVVEIRKAIDKDRRYYSRLPEGSKQKKLYSTYNFEKLDPVKISMLFRERRAITPYEFAELDFDNKALVWSAKYLNKAKKVGDSDPKSAR